MLTMTVSAATGVRRPNNSHNHSQTATNTTRPSIIMTVAQAIRPYVVCAVLRNVTFNKSSWNSFLNLQDKLHQVHNAALLSSIMNQ